MPTFNILIFFYILGTSNLASSKSPNFPIRIGTPSKLTNVDPVLVLSTAEMELVSSYCRPLTKINDNGEIEGELVKSWSISKDLKKYTFHINKNIIFHDLSNLTIEDVIFSLSRHFWKKNKSEYRHHLAFATGSSEFIQDGENLGNISKLDSNKFTFKLHKPYLPFLYMLSQTCLCIVKKDSPLIGTGPMSIKKGYRPYSWTLTPFKKNLKNPPTVKIHYQTYFDHKKAMDEFNNKKLDLLIGSQFAKNKAAPKDLINNLDIIAINHFLLNTNKDIMKSTNVRRSLGKLLQHLAWKNENIATNQFISRSFIPTGFFSNTMNKEPLSSKTILNHVKILKEKI